jgi:hypothetical protein
MKTITKQIRAERKLDAQCRQEAYSLLTLEQKLARLDAQCASRSSEGTELPINGAKKQRARLEMTKSPETKRSPKS